MATLKSLQQKFRKENDILLEELEKQLTKKHAQVYKSLTTLSTEYNDKYTGSVLTGTQRKALNKNIASRTATILTTQKLLYDKALDNTLENIYTGYSYSYSKVSESFVSYKKLTPSQLKIIKLDKINGKTYIDRLTFHSKNLNKTTSAVIQNGIRNGRSNQDIAKMIANRVNVSEGHALTIARTETGRIGSQGMKLAQDNAISQGLKFKKKWLHYGSNDPRQDHIQMDGTVVNQGEEFRLPNGETCQYPRIGLSAEQTINCYCDVEEFFEGFDSTERRQGSQIIDVGSYDHYKKANED